MLLKVMKLSAGEEKIYTPNCLQKGGPSFTRDDGVDSIARSINVLRDMSVNHRHVLRSRP